MNALTGSPDRKNTRRTRIRIETLEQRRFFSVTTIAWNTVNQTIDGFGASSAWTTQSVTSSQSQLLFSPTDGAGLSMLRSRINEDATTLSPNTPVAAGSYEVQTMQAAAAMGVTVWSTPWSPPAAWKSNQSVDNGGYLLTADYQAYANYLAQYVVTMKNDGIPIYGISLQNEPDENVSYDSCTWTAAQLAAFLPDVVTAFASYGVSGTKIILPEESGWHWELANTVMNTPALNADVSIYADHDYDNGSGTVPGAAGKQLWMTEVYDPNTTTCIAAGLWVAQNVYNMIVTSGANAYDYWWIHEGGYSGNGTLLGGDWQQTPLFWALGNYAKFIRPGWNNIGETNDGGLTTSAYKNSSTGDFATVLVNSSTSPITETINLSGAYAPVLTPWVTSATQNLVQQTPIPATGNGGSFSYTIPAQSVVTLTGTATSTAVTAPPAGLTASASGPTTMSLSWTSNVTGATGYTVQRSNDDANWTTLSNNISSGTYSYNDSSLTPNTLYYYRLIANNGSVYSNVSYQLTQPNAVTNLSASYSTSTLNVTLNWTASTTSGVDCEVLRSSDGGSTWTQLAADVSNSSHTYTDTTAPEAAALMYQVLAINGANTSAAVNANVTTTVVRAPSGLTAVAGSAVGSVNVSWTSNSNQPVTTYIERSSNNGTSWTVLGSVASGVTTYTDPAPGAGSFQYRVRAYYNSTYSAYSSTASFSVNVLSLNGSSGNNTFYLKDSGSTLDIWINSATPGSGTPTQTDPVASYTSISITGGSGTNSLTLDYSGGDPTNGSVTFNGSTGSNTLIIKGETTSVAATLSSNSLALGSDSINYTNLNYLDLDLGSGTNTFNAGSPALTPLLTLTIDTGSTLTLGPSSNLAVNTIVSDAGFFNLGGQNESIDQLTGNGTINSSAGTLTIGSYNGSSTFAGAISGGLSLDKVGTGIFTNTGDSSYTGNTTVDAGTLGFVPATGSDNIGSVNSSIFVAPANTDNGTLVVGPNANLAAGGTYGGLFLACNSDSNNGGGIGTINQTGGSITVASGVTYLAGANTVNNGADAVWNFSGGVANLTASLTMSINNNSVSYLNISGTAQLNMLNNSSIGLGTYYTRPATITQSGGSITFYSDGGSTIGGTGTLNLNKGGGTYLYNMTGGTLTVPTVTATASGGSAVINVSGGTLAAAGNTNNFISTGITLRVRSGGVTVNNNGYAVTIAQPLIHDSTLGSAADGGLNIVGGGTLTLTGTNTYTGPTNVSSGSTTLNYVAPANGTYPTATLSALYIAIGSVVQFNSPNSGRALLQISTANSWTGQLDLRGNDLLVHGGQSAMTIINSLVSSGYNQGNWNGPGIVCSLAAASGSHLQALGVILNNQGTNAQFGSSNHFDGVSPAATDVLVKFTYYGDATLDGKVDGSDFSRIDSGLLKPSTGWFNGDFNYDGVLNGSDYTLIDNAYNTQGASMAAELADVPLAMNATRVTSPNAVPLFSDQPVTVPLWSDASSFTDDDTHRRSKGTFAAIEMAISQG